MTKSFFRAKGQQKGKTVNGRLTTCSFANFLQQVNCSNYLKTLFLKTLGRSLDHYFCWDNHFLAQMSFKNTRMMGDQFDVTILLYKI